MRYLILVAFSALISISRAQELNCTVTIIFDAKLEVNSAEKDIFDQLKQMMTDFMNNTKWTKDRFKTEERINCQIQFQVNSIPSPGTYVGSLQVQSTRPVYNSSYNTALLNFQDDDISFDYLRNNLMAYAPNQYRDELTSVLAFYAYYIIALDYDSYSLKGGESYFQEAQQIVSNAQSSASQGWKSGAQGKHNRYWLVDNALQELFEPYRECLYEYHRKGMDALFDDKVQARKNITVALAKLSKVSQSRPNSINVLNFAQAKRNELKNLYKDATVDEKNEVVAILKKIDPTNSSKYDEILL